MFPPLSQTLTSSSALTVNAPVAFQVVRAHAERPALQKHPEDAANPRLSKLPHCTPDLRASGRVPGIQQWVGTCLSCQHSMRVWLLTWTTSVRKMCLLLCWALITLSLCPHVNLRLLQQRQGCVDHQTCGVLQGQGHLPGQQCKWLRGYAPKNGIKCPPNMPQRGLGQKCPQIKDNRAKNSPHNSSKSIMAVTIKVKCENEWKILIFNG